MGENLKYQFDQLISFIGKIRNCIIEIQKNAHKNKTDNDNIQPCIYNLIEQILVIHSNQQHMYQQNLGCHLCCYNEQRQDITHKYLDKISMESNYEIKFDNKQIQIQVQGNLYTELCKGIKNFDQHQYLVDFSYYLTNLILSNIGKTKDEIDEKLEFQFKDFLEKSNDEFSKYYEYYNRDIVFEAKYENEIIYNQDYIQLLAFVSHLSRQNDKQCVPYEYNIKSYAMMHQELTITNYITNKLITSTLQTLNTINSQKLIFYYYCIYYELQQCIQQNKTIIQCGDIKRRLPDTYIFGANKIIVLHEDQQNSIKHLTNDIKVHEQPIEDISLYTLRNIDCGKLQCQDSNSQIQTKNYYYNCLHIVATIDNNFEGKITNLYGKQFRGLSISEQNYDNMINYISEDILEIHSGVDYFDEKFVFDKLEEKKQNEIDKTFSNKGLNIREKIKMFDQKIHKTIQKDDDNQSKIITNCNQGKNRSTFIAAFLMNYFTYSFMKKIFEIDINDSLYQLIVFYYKALNHGSFQKTNLIPDYITKRQFVEKIKSIFDILYQYTNETMNKKNKDGGHFVLCKKCNKKTAQIN